MALFYWIMERILYPRSEIRTFNGMSVEIKRYTCGELVPQEYASIAEEFRPLTGIGFLRSNFEDPLFVKDVNDHIIGAERLIVARRLMDNFPAAFIASKKVRALDLDFYYLSGIITHPNFRGSGLGHYLLATDLLEAKQEAIALCTQSKRMRGLLHKVASINYDLSVRMAANKFEGSKFMKVGNVIKGLYVNSFEGGKSLYEDQIQFEEIAIDDMSGMNWREGDSVVLAGYVNPEDKLREDVERIIPSFKPGFGN